MSVEAHSKQTLDRLHKLIALRGWIAHSEFFAEDGYRAVLADIQGAFPDARLELIRLMVEGEWAMGQYWFEGTHLGVARHPHAHYGLLAGLAPTGRSVRVLQMNLYRIVNGQIVELSETCDVVAIVKQLGLELSIFSAAETDSSTA